MIPSPKTAYQIAQVTSPLSPGRGEVRVFCLDKFYRGEGDLKKQ